MPLRHRGSARAGGLYALGAFTIWGASPVYFKWVATVSPLEVVAHRVVWSALLVGLLIVAGRRTAALTTAFRSRPMLARLLLSSLLVSVNWLIFIWAVANDRVLEASLGYYINPLFNVVLGVLLLGERLRRIQWWAIALGAIGVANLIITQGNLPWVALALAVSFGFYGYMRKLTDVDAFTGLLVETLLLTPVALLYLLYLGQRGALAFTSVSPGLDLLLVLAGLVTATPLVLFAAAARRLRLSTLGQLQYTVPTGQFLLAVFAFGEPFTGAHAVTFGLIWLALAIYAADTWRTERWRATPGPDAPPSR